MMSDILFCLEESCLLMCLYILYILLIQRFLFNLVKLWSSAEIAAKRQKFESKTYIKEARKREYFNNAIYVFLLKGSVKCITFYLFLIN